MPRTRRDYQRYARRGTTTERGYGCDHVRKLAVALARWRPGDPCAQCGQPMWSRWTYDSRGRRVSAIDLGHTPDRTGYIGLCHRFCNRSEGAQRGNRMRSAAKRWAASRAWL